MPSQRGEIYRPLRRRRHSANHDHKLSMSRSAACRFGSSSGNLAKFTAILRASSSLILIKVQICQPCFKWRSKSKKNAPLSRHDLDNQIRNRRPETSSKELLEACVAFAMGLTFVIGLKSAPR